MKVLLDITPSLEGIEAYWDEHPKERALDGHADRPYAACVTRVLTEALMTNIAAVTLTTLLDIGENFP